MMAKRTEEYIAMIKATVRLTSAVKNELTSLSQELVARELISVDQGVELRNGNISAVDRAANLVALVTNKVEQDRKNFYYFVEILNDNQSTYKEILKDLQPIYATGKHVYNKGARAVLTVNQPWYHKKLSREDAESKLGAMDTNSFLVRESAQEAGKLVLSTDSGGKFYHFPIERGVGSYQVEGTDEPFPSVVELIDYYRQHGLPESDNGDVVILESPCICDAFLLSSHSESSNGEVTTFITSSVPKPVRSMSTVYTYVDVTVDDYDYDKRPDRPVNVTADEGRERAFTSDDDLKEKPSSSKQLNTPEEPRPSCLPSPPTARRPPAPKPKPLAKKPSAPHVLGGGGGGGPPLSAPRQHSKMVVTSSDGSAGARSRGPGEERSTVHMKNVPPPRPSSHVQKLQSESTVKAQMPYWYRPQFSREEAISFVRNLDPGSFIVRDSTTILGGYAITIKISQDQVRQRRKMAESVPVTEDMLVTHFLIEIDPEGIRLQGWNERAFKTLPDFIAHHTVEKLCLPCKLVLPKSTSGGGGAPQVRRKPAGMEQALQTGAMHNRLSYTEVDPNQEIRVEPLPAQMSATDDMWVKVKYNTAGRPSQQDSLRRRSSSSSNLTNTMTSASGSECYSKLAELMINVTGQPGQQVHTENQPVTYESAKVKDSTSTDHTPRSRGRVGSATAMSIVKKLLKKVVTKGISHQFKAVTIGACISAEKLPANMFHVTNIGDNGKGIMQVTETELIFTDKRTTESCGWPLKFLRRYGCDGEVFSFEAGRKCPGGAGLHRFESERASQIFDMVARNLNPGNLQPPAGELSPFPSQSHPPDQNTLVSHTSVSPLPGSNHVDEPNHASIDHSSNPRVQAKNGLDPTSHVHVPSQRPVGYKEIVLDRPPKKHPVPQGEKEPRT